MDFALAGQVVQLVRAELQLLGLEAGDHIGALARAADGAVQAQQARQAVTQTRQLRRIDLEPQLVPGPAEAAVQVQRIAGHLQIGPGRQKTHAGQLQVTTAAHGQIAIAAVVNAETELDLQLRREGAGCVEVHVDARAHRLRRRCAAGATPLVDRWRGDGLQDGRGVEVQQPALEGVIHRAHGLQGAGSFQARFASGQGRLPYLYPIGADDGIHMELQGAVLQGQQQLLGVWRQRHVDRPGQPGGTHLAMDLAEIEFIDAQLELAGHGGLLARLRAARAELAATFDAGVAGQADIQPRQGLLLQIQLQIGAGREQGQQLLVQAARAGIGDVHPAGHLQRGIGREPGRRSEVGAQVEVGCRCRGVEGLRIEMLQIDPGALERDRGKGCGDDVGVALEPVATGREGDAQFLQRARQLGCQPVLLLERALLVGAGQFQPAADGEGTLAVQMQQGRGLAVGGHDPVQHQCVLHAVGAAVQFQVRQFGGGRPLGQAQVAQADLADLHGQGDVQRGRQGGRLGRRGLLFQLHRAHAQVVDAELALQHCQVPAGVDAVDIEDALPILIV